LGIGRDKCTCAPPASDPADPPMNNQTKNILIGVLLFCLAVAILTIIIGP
jgi:hypothetical protein